MKTDYNILNVIIFGTSFYLWIFGMIIGIPLGYAGENELLFAFFCGIGSMIISFIAMFIYIMIAVSWYISNIILDPNSEESKEYYQSIEQYMSIYIDDIFYRTESKQDWINHSNS